MNIIQNIDIGSFDNKIIICEPSARNEFYRLRRDNPTLNFSLITPYEVLTIFSYDYSWDGIKYLINNKGYTYDEANELLSILSYQNFDELNLDPSSYIDEAIINKFVEIQKELLSHGYLRINETKRQIFLNKDVIYYEIKNVQPLTYRLSTMVSSETQILTKEFTNLNHKVITFPDKFEEVHYVLNHICHLIYEKHISTKDICLCVADGEYLDIIELFAKRYKLKFSYPRDKQIYDSQLYKNIRNSLLNVESLTLESLNNVLIEFQEHNTSNPNVETIVQHIRVYYEDNKSIEEQLDLYDQIFKSIPYQEVVGIDWIDIIQEPMFDNNKHYYVLGFKNTSYPVVEMDNGYINNDVRDRLNLFTTRQNNENTKHSLLRFLNTSKIELITYDRTCDDGVGMSYIVNRFIHNNDDKCIYNSDEVIQNYEYSIEAAQVIHKLLINNKEDNDKRLNAYNQNIVLPELYNYSFNGINNFSLPSERRLSASGLKNFVVCPYKYYLQHLLRLRDIDSHFYFVLGHVCHKCNEVVTKKLINNETYDVDEIFYNALNKELENENLPYVEVELIKNLLPYVREQIAFTVRHDFHELKDAEIEVEKDFCVDFVTKNNNKIKLNGQIDKLVKSNGSYMIYDYKTSAKPSSEVPNSKGGEENQRLTDSMRFAMQLPFYYYCVNKMIENGSYSEGKIYSLLISRIFPAADKMKKDKNLENEELNDFDNDEIMKYYGRYKSCGLIGSDDVLYNQLICDKAYYTNSKSNKLSDEDFEVINKYTEDMINYYDDVVNSAEFRIKPVGMTSADGPCSMCPYKDICFIDDKETIYHYGFDEALEFNKIYYPELAERMMKELESSEEENNGND